MDGEKIQWHILDNGVFNTTCAMTTDDIKHLRGDNWYRPIVKYMENDILEIRDTGHWLEARRKLEDMRQHSKAEEE